MRQRPKAPVRYQLARRLRGPTPAPTPEKPRLRLRHLLEIAAFLVAVTAALVAYLELRTAREERLTPYRAVIFTAQFDSYRDFAKLSDQVGTLWRRFTERGIQLRQRRQFFDSMMSGLRTGRVPVSAANWCTEAREHAQQVERALSDLSVALITAEAIWPEELQDGLQRQKQALDEVRNRNSGLLTSYPNQVRSRTPDECARVVNHVGESLYDLTHAVGDSLLEMRMALRFDVINSIPRE